MRSFITLLLAFVLAACQSEERLTLAEAKQVTANFATPVLVVPPRSIDDILAILETPRTADRTLLAKLSRQAERSISATQDAAIQANAYFSRASAAREK